MTLRFLVLAALFLVPHTFSTTRASDELVPENVRKGLRTVARDMARLGDAEELATMRALLLALGDTEEVLTRFDRSWERDLARGEDTERARAAAAKRLRREVDELGDALGAEADPGRVRELARVVLQLDSESAAAHAVFGRREVDGRWLTPNEVEETTGATRVTDLVRAARLLEVDVERGTSTLHGATSVYGDAAPMASLGGIRLHGGLAPAKLERVLREALRAAALSKALLGGDLELPYEVETHDLVIARDEETYRAALELALAEGGIEQDQYDFHQRAELASFLDRRGWRVTRWKPEASLQALVLWDIVGAWMGRGVQPCLSAGHVNWVCLNFLGAEIPTSTWSEERAASQRTTSTQVQSDEILWYATKRSLYGCRSWMSGRVRAGDRFPWSRSFQDQEGKIQDIPLLKTTLVCEYLQDIEALGGLVDHTRDRLDPGAAFEEVLGDLEVFDRNWRRWLLGDPETAPGLLQRLAGTTSEEVTDPEARRLLARLGKIRDRAFAYVGRYVEPLALDPELSAGARAHASYLTQHFEQVTSWPEAHEQYSDRAGFSTAGAWAGAHSVIDPNGDPQAALDLWMGTFYHRLPLLDPGLIGVGFGFEGDVTVLDVTSLVTHTGLSSWVVWPVGDAKGVPTGFVAELPNPVPGENQRQLGYPITLQAWWGGGTDAEHAIEMRLFRGRRTDDPEVPCWFLTPDAPLFEELAPDGAYCLIPKSKLKPRTRYTVEAVSTTAGRRHVWSFTTK